MPRRPPNSIPWKDPYEHLEEDLEREIAEIVAVYGHPDPLPRGGGRQRPNAFYGQLTKSQISRIRKIVRDGGDAEIPKLARFFGVKKSYILIALKRL